MKRVLMPLAGGFEEIEFVTTADILRRAGVCVVSASLSEQRLVVGAHDISVQADTTLEEVLQEADLVAKFDAVILAGGSGGMMNLKADTRVLRILKQFCDNGVLTAAICASPIVLDAAGVLSAETKFTCYPSCEEGLKGVFCAEVVCESGSVLTSAGPATAVLFALKIVQKLCGEGRAKELESELLLPLLRKSL